MGVYLKDFFKIIFINLIVKPLLFVFLVVLVYVRPGLIIQIKDYFIKNRIIT